MFFFVVNFVRSFPVSQGLELFPTRDLRPPSPLSLSKGLLGNYVPNPQYMADSAMPVPILPRDTLIFVQEIGEGCFGKVFKGKRNKMVEDLSCQ
ncbi:hypothetical protein RUM43_009157 [Polyplax serrata]|uniref:Uncharacterized protein n=1 Tax=Polyplax serrata TaxID=468196 RepID=A0AAN8NP05_POLSC